MLLHSFLLHWKIIALKAHHLKKARPNKGQSKTAGTGQNQLRIIGGKWRGRKLEFPLLSGLRPTGDRVRETLFNWLAPTINGANCLDLFAGSGALGLEALSRGASSVQFVDNHSDATSTLKAHCERLGAGNAQISTADGLKWLASSAPETAFDVVFLDPPFDAPLLQPAIDALNNSNCLAPAALIYIETARNQPPAEIPVTWQLLKSKTTGQVCYQLFCHN